MSQKKKVCRNKYASASFLGSVPTWFDRHSRIYKSIPAEKIMSHATDDSSQELSTAIFCLFFLQTTTVTTTGHEGESMVSVPGFASQAAAVPLGYFFFFPVRLDRRNNTAAHAPEADAIAVLGD